MEKTRRKFKIPISPPLLLFLCIVLLCCFNQKSFSDYPHINRLTPDDVLFAQLEESVSEYYRASYQEEEIPALQIFQYTMVESRSLFSLAAQCNLTYESIASLNRIENAVTLDAGTKILLPNMPGLFVPFEAKNELEQLLHKALEREDYVSYPIVVTFQERKVPYHFIPGGRFTPDELSYFLGIFFHNPLPRGEGAISSLYGPRRNPFTGELQFHYGVDLATDIGIDVYATRYGKVIQKGYDERYGHYVLLEHSGGYKSFYGHLNYITVELNQTVKSGSIIGTVGSTGISTGPHLHFEIWQNDSAVDPLPLLPKDY